MSKTGDEMLVALRIFKNKGALNSSDDDMMKGPLCVDSVLSWHTP
jgi:hypothetical protein